MELLTIIFIALSLAMDCFAISLSTGAANEKKNIALKLSVFFGLFQAGMFLLGWLGAFSFRSLIEGADHWIALSLLIIIGGKMLYEAIEDKEEKKINFSSNRMILLLSIATSIDALAVGISFAFLKEPLFWPTTTIGLASFFMTIIGTRIGKKAQNILGRKAEIAGGIILILIGLKIFLEHTL